MKYHNIPEKTLEEIKRQLDSKDESEVIEGLLSLTMYEYDYNFSMNTVFDFIENSKANLQRVSILCTGHLARIHKKIDSERFLHIIRNQEITRNHKNTINDVIDDFNLFTDAKIKKI